MTEALTYDNPFEDLSYAEVSARLAEPYADDQTNFEKVIDFHKKFGSVLNQWPPSTSEIKLRHRLIEEEFIELSDELHVMYLAIEKQNIAKELADLLYVVYGTAASFGINIDKVFQAVHNSNMSKSLDTKRADGKVLKGDNYFEPELGFVNG